MKYSQAFILFLIGIIAALFGVCFKLMDCLLASLLLILGMTFEGGATLLLRGSW